MIRIVPLLALLMATQTMKAADLSVLRSAVTIPTAVALLRPPSTSSVELQVPIPADAEARIQAVTRELDHYFDLLVESYSIPIRTLLKEIYYGQKFVLTLPNLVAREGVFARTTISLDDAGTPTYTIAIDPLLQKCGSLRRLKMIHEVAVHIGQTHQRITEGSPRLYAMEKNSGVFSQFTELSAAVVEKRVIDAIAIAAVGWEIRREVSDAKLVDELLRDLKFRREASFALYPWLRQRLAYDGTAAQDRLSEYEIKQFVNFYETRELNRSLASDAATKTPR